MLVFKTILSFLNRNKVTILGIAVLTAGVLAVLKVSGKEIPFVKKAPSYKTTTVERKTLKKTVSASGKIKSEEEVTLKFQTSGYLVWVGVKKGDKVKKWQAIASLDKEQLEKELRQELMDYLNERWNFEKDRHTYDIKTDNLDRYTLEYDIRNLVDKAQFDLDRTVLDVEIKNLAIKYATLWTPIEGIVTALDVPSAGVNITPATATFTISNSDKLVFSAKVDEADIGQVKEGQEATLILDAYPDEPIKGSVLKVEFISTTTTTGATAFEVKFPLPENINEKFKIGMNGDVEIVISQEENALVVPFESVREKNGEHFLWILEGNLPVRKRVEIGSSGEIETQILEGVREGEIVILSDFKNLEKNLNK